MTILYITIYNEGEDNGGNCCDVPSVEVVASDTVDDSV